MRFKHVRSGSGGVNVSGGEEKVEPCGLCHYGSLCALPYAQRVIEDGAKRERTSLEMDILFLPVIV